MLTLKKTIVPLMSAFIASLKAVLKTTLQPKWTWTAIRQPTSRSWTRPTAMIPN